MKFRKKPVVIEAFLVGSTNIYPEWLWNAISENTVVTFGGDGWGSAFTACDIITLEGTMRAAEGDWIIKGIAGELYPCKPDIFAATYEPAEVTS